MTDSSPSDHHRHSLARLEDELAAATAQLEEYQRLIDEMPGIYEVKYGSQLRDVAQDIRLLMEEREGLQRQLRRCLTGQTESHGLVLSGQPRPSWQFPAFAAAAQRRLLTPRAWQLALVAVASTLALSLLIPLAARLQKRQSPALPQALPSAPKAIKSPTPVGSPQASVPQLRLRARGEVWLELRSLKDTSMFQGTLQQGQELFIPLGDGLRIRAGRPHLLDIALPGQSHAPLGAANDHSWRTFSAPAPGGQATGQVSSPQGTVVISALF